MNYPLIHINSAPLQSPLERPYLGCKNMVAISLGESLYDSRFSTRGAPYRNQRWQPLPSHGERH